MPSHGILEKWNGGTMIPVSSCFSEWCHSSASGDSAFDSEGQPV